MRLIRVLHVTASLGCGGRERQLAELLQRGRSNSVLSHLVVMSSEIHYDHVYRAGIPVSIIARKFRRDPAPLLDVRRLCLKFKPHAIHAWDSMAAVYSGIIARTHRVKFINGMIRDAAPLSVLGKQSVRAKITFPLSDVIVGNSRAGLAAYRAPRDKSICIHNGFDMLRVGRLEDPLEIKRKLGVKTAIAIGMVADFSPYKDYRSFLSAADRILPARGDVTFLAVGPKTDSVECLSLTRPENRGRVVNLGGVKDVESIINAMDIGVLATNVINHGEGISNSIMEYMALGKPVLATDHGGNREIVLHGRTGFLVEPLSPDGIARALAFLLDNPDKAKEWGREGRRRIISDFGMQKMLDKYGALYDSIV